MKYRDVKPYSFVRYVNYIVETWYTANGCNEPEQIEEYVSTFVKEIVFHLSTCVDKGFRKEPDDPMNDITSVEIDKHAIKPWILGSEDCERIGYGRCREILKEDVFIVQRCALEV